MLDLSIYKFSVLFTIVLVSSQSVAWTSSGSTYYAQCLCAHVARIGVLGGNFARPNTIRPAQVLGQQARLALQLSSSLHERPALAGRENYSTNQEGGTCQQIWKAQYAFERGWWVYALGHEPMTRPRAQLACSHMQPSMRTCKRKHFQGFSMRVPCNA